MLSNTINYAISLPQTTRLLFENYIGSMHPCIVTNGMPVLEYSYESAEFRNPNRKVWYTEVAVSTFAPFCW